MGKLKICGGIFAILVGVLILINGLINLIGAADIGSLIVALMLAIPVILGGILGLASKVTAGGVIVSIIAGFYLFLTILPSILTLPDYFVHVPLSLFLSRWDLYMILTPFDLVLPYEGLLIFFGGIFLLASVNERAEEVKK